MDKNRKSALMAFGGIGLAIASSDPVLAASTAQSAMIESSAPSSFVITQDETWAWNLATAKTYYNAWDGTLPIPGCTGGGTGGCVTAPTTPAAPSPRDQKINPIANGEQCTFFNGGTLGGTDTYTQTVNVVVNSGPAAQRGTWKFTFHYNISPTGDGSVPAHTT